MSFKIKPIDEDSLNRKLEKETKSKKFPKCFKTKVRISKVNMKVMKNWILEEVDKLLKDDDIVVDYLYELLIAEDEPDIKLIHLQMVDFLGEKDAIEFCTRLWDLLISGSNDKDGIPKELIEEKKKEVERKTQANSSRVSERDEAVDTDKRGRELPPRKTNYNRSQYNADKRTRSPTRERKTNEKLYRERF